MTTLNMSNHAQARFSQRGINPNDLSLLLRIGSETHEGFMVRERDYRNFERDIKKLLQRVRRTVGKRIIVHSGEVITVYHCNKRKVKSVLRIAKEKGLSKC